MTLLPDIREIKVDIDKIENKFLNEKNISLFLLRLDKIHPEISGNKLFKLYYFLENAVLEKKKIITFGGAYSNHLAATAAACKLYGIKCIGIVRGEQPKQLSNTLLYCIEKGMQLEYISREDYRRKDQEEFKMQLIDIHGDYVLVPEGGYSKTGLEGATRISTLYLDKKLTHICCPTGTATTLAGLIKGSSAGQKIIGFTALKGLNDFETSIKFLTGTISYKNYCLINEFHFGGYAKTNPELISFMKSFYKEFEIPTDFVYTGKMMFGVFELIKKNYFPGGSKILCIHTGGLQGNLSLKPETLNF
jgi:1-aminocyclopropane-1-carboxylate deaminase